MENAWLGLTAALAYLIGSFPTAYFVIKKMLGKDIRAEGSGNVGTMNTYGVLKADKPRRQAIFGLFLTLASDLSKGILAIYIGRWLAITGYNPLAGLIIAATFVVLGHNYPFYFRFRQGGRGIAPLMGILLALKPALFGVWGSTMILSILLSQRIMTRRTALDSFNRIFSVIGRQSTGRFIGLSVSLIPIYFFGTRLFFPVLLATVLVLIKHADIIKSLFGKLRKNRIEGS
jgi:acyl-phosphate glycerol 3-phosphate acyltransferase